MKMIEQSLETGTTMVRRRDELDAVCDFTRMKRLHCLI